jgi:hypothetical protein
MLEKWLAGYLRAWRSDDPAEIGALFTADALYYTGPFDEPWAGREAIIAGWIGRGDSQNQWTFRHEILAVEGATGVVRGWTVYAATAEEPETEYSNIWVVRLVDGGQAREFHEWWVERARET